MSAPLPPPGPVAGGSFAIDLDRAPQVLRELEDAREQLNQVRSEALRLGTVDPGSDDEVSRDAAALLGAVAVDGPGSFVDALDGGLQRLDDLIRAIQAELRSYGHAERENGIGFAERA